MRHLVLLIGLLAAAAPGFAADGYTLQRHQGIMYFVAVDADRAGDIAIYRRAIDELCAPNAVCQVLFWEGEAPNGLPMSREQDRSKAAYWQANPKKGEKRLFVDCDRFADIEGAECF